MYSPAIKTKTPLEKDGVFSLYYLNPIYHFPKLYLYFILIETFRITMFFCAAFKNSPLKTKNILSYHAIHNSIFNFIQNFSFIKRRTKYSFFLLFLLNNQLLIKQIHFS